MLFLERFDLLWGLSKGIVLIFGRVDVGIDVLMVEVRVILLFLLIYYGVLFK